MAETKGRRHYARRDEWLVGDVVNYRLLLQPAVCKVHFAGKNCGHILKRLEEDEALIKRHPRALPGGISFITPRIAACTKSGAPAERANPPGASALDCAIGINVFCFLDKFRRYKVDHRELVTLFGRRAAGRGRARTDRARRARAPDASPRLPGRA